MKQIYDTAFFRRRRVLIYPLIAAAVAAGQWIADAPESPSPKSWAILFVGMMLAGANALKAYLENPASPAK